MPLAEAYAWPMHGERMSDQQARDEAITMLLAGHETTALAIKYALLSLSQHLGCETRLREELQCLGGCAPMVADLARLPYLEAVVKETWRLSRPRGCSGAS